MRVTSARECVPSPKLQFPDLEDGHNHTTDLPGPMLSSQCQTSRTVAVVVTEFPRTRFERLRRNHSVLGGAIPAPCPPEHPPLSS